MKNCLGIWASRNDGGGISDVELHVNLWKVKKLWKWRCRRVLTAFRRKATLQFLDIGIKFQPSGLKHIHLYLPFEVRKADIHDLGECLRSRESVQGLFNEDYEVSLPPQHGKHAAIPARDGGNDDFDIYSIDTAVDTDVTLAPSFDGTILTFHIENYVRPGGSKNLYFRFRVHGLNDKNFSETYRPRDSFFQTAFSSTEVIDFRINEARNLQDSLLQKIEKGSKVTFKKLHFFVMRDIEDDLVASSNAPKGSRILEDALWKEFNLSEFRLTGMVAYHWKGQSSEKSPLKGFGEFAKFVFKRNNFVTIATYIVVLGFFSILFNLLASCIFDLFNPSISCVLF